MEHPTILLAEGRTKRAVQRAEDVHTSKGSERAVTSRYSPIPEAASWLKNGDSGPVSTNDLMSGTPESARACRSYSRRGRRLSVRKARSRLGTFADKWPSECDLNLS